MKVATAAWMLKVQVEREREALEAANALHTELISSANDSLKRLRDGK